MMIKTIVLYCFVVLTFATIPSTNGKLTHLTACTKGRITFYEGYEIGGSCNLGEVSTSVTEGYMFTTAPSEAFIDGANKCGICYELTGFDGAIRVMVTNTCPATDFLCSGDMFHFDLAYNAKPYLYYEENGNPDGNITFRMVSCDLSGNIKIKVDMANHVNYYFVVMNHVIGLKKTAYSLDNGVTYTELERPEHNTYHIGTNADINLPFKIKLTSIADEEVVFDVTSLEAGTFDSGVQFTVPQDTYFDVDTLEKTTKPDDVDECCKPTDDVATVYTDQIHGMWLPVNIDEVNCTEYPYKGPYCIKSTIDNWESIWFWGTQVVKTNLYTNLTFYVKTDAAGDFLAPATTLTSGRTPITIEKANIWQYVNLPMDYFGEGDDFESFSFCNVGDKRTFYFDEIRWIPSDVDTSICADKNINNGISYGCGISIITLTSVLLVVITFI